MADTTKGKLEEAGHKIAETASTVAHKIADGAAHAADWVKEKTGIGDKHAGAAVPTADIRPHMAVISSCGCKVGVVDHLDGAAIKLTHKDSPDGLHHFIPVGWVTRVDDQVHLRKNATETKQEWKGSAAGCAACGG